MNLETPPPAWSLRSAALPLGVAAVTAAATVFVALNNPHVPGALGVCPWVLMTGLYCPGCGGTRAVYDLAHGDVAGAMSMNPLFTLAVPLLGLLWMRWFLRSQGFQIKRWRYSNALAYGLPVVMVAFTILRNLPPFAPYLAP